MKKLEKKIVIPAKKPRGTPAPAERVIPNPKKERARKICREKIRIEDDEQPKEL